MSSSESDRVQSVRNGWTNMLRAEVLRSDIADLPRVTAVGVWLATFADADGGNAFPSRETLARLAGCSVDTVTAAVNVLMHVGVLVRRRRPNKSAVYQLLLPMESPDWAAHMHLITDTRQRRAHAAEKKRAAEARTASVDAVRKASVAGVDHNPSTYGRDPLPDEDVLGLSPQPQVVGARADEGTTPSSSQPDAPERATPTLHAVPPAPGAQVKTQSGSGQRPLLLSVRTAAEVSPEERAQLRRDATPDDIRRAIAELGRKEAIALYGLLRTSPYLVDSPPHGLEGDAREAQ